MLKILNFGCNPQIFCVTLKSITDGGKQKMNLIYRGNSYQSQEIATQVELSFKTAKYRGCTYSISASTAQRPTFKPKLTYRGCQIV